MLRFFSASEPEPQLPLGAYAGDLTAIVGTSLLVAVAFGVMHLMVSRALPLVWPSTSGISSPASSDLIMQVMWLLGCTPLPIMYAVALSELHSTPLMRWRGCSEIAEYAFLLHVGSSLYECATYVYHGKPWVYMVHHAVVLYCYIGVLYIGALHFWFAWAGLVEATNLHVCFLKICLIMNVCRRTVAEAVNGGCLYVTYLLLRLVSLPLAIAAYAYDAYRFPDTTWGWAMVAGGATPAMAASAPVCTLVIWGMSCVWFAPIHKGMMKVLRGDDPTPSQEELDEHLMKEQKAESAKQNGSHDRERDISPTPTQQQGLKARA